MQYRIFVPEGSVEAIYQPLFPMIGFKEGGSTVRRPLRQEEVEDCLIFDIKTLSGKNPYAFSEKFLGRLGVGRYDILAVEGGNMERVVAAIQIQSDRRLGILRNSLEACEGTGEIFTARYPFSTGQKEDARMIILEGEGKPEFLREQIEKRLRELYGDKFAFTEEILFDRF